MTLQWSYILSGYVYLLASDRNGTLYIGVTRDLLRRVWEHKEELVDGFSKQYGTKMLVWYEMHQGMIEAIQREKQLKKWKREWKVELIEEANPYWNDLYAGLIG